MAGVGVGGGDLSPRSQRSRKLRNVTRNGKSRSIGQDDIYQNIDILFDKVKTENTQLRRRQLLPRMGDRQHRAGGRELQAGGKQQRATADSCSPKFCRLPGVSSAGELAWLLAPLTWRGCRPAAAPSRCSLYPASPAACRWSDRASGRPAAACPGLEDVTDGTTRPVSVGRSTVTVSRSAGET